MNLKPHLHKKRFYNHHNGSIKTYVKSVLVTIKHMLFKKRTPYFPHGKDHTIAAWTAQPHFTTTPDKTTVTWLGHATFLCQLGGYNIITDPVFDEISRFAPRMMPSPLKNTKLPTIDVVLISHNHHDHLDKKSLKTLHKHNPLFLVPHGDKVWFNKHGFTRVIEYLWWEQQTLPVKNNAQPVTIQFLPAHHWSGRSLFTINRSLWGSWLMSHNDQSIYFGGDTAFSEHFKIIGDAVKKIDIALLPIGPCEPRGGMQDSHINPDEALQAFKDLNATHFIPMHWGTFKQGADNFHHAIDLLTSAWKKHVPENNKQLHIVKCGETKEFYAKDILQQPYTQHATSDHVQTDHLMPG